ncbi:glycosidase [Streptomyces sp. NPDC049954]|uniref:glycoside hydrolase family 130 protein n=1 Tax=Streptomyces sp. NPDC049954 TaxID=3155779 RepID=UPI00342A41D2
MHPSQPTAPTGPFALRRLGVLMRPEPGLAQEEWGVLNPGAARGPDGTLHLFPRLVAAGNRSAIGRAVVVHDASGDPVSVRRLGLALSPQEEWERSGDRLAGVEDPRVTRLAEAGLWVMTYTALGPFGPRAALAVSTDLESWRRLGPVSFRYEPELGADFNLYPNKDLAFFPEPVTAPDGSRCFAMLHRPFYDLWSVVPQAPTVLPRGITDDRPSIWVSYVPVEEVLADPRCLARLGQHRVVAHPLHDWERTKIGAGPAPLRVPEGWLLVHHGVTGPKSYDWPQPGVCYRAGAMLLDARDVTRVLWRSPVPLLEPEEPEETEGIVPRVVFPTALDERPDGEVDVFYGMADDKIGVARLSRTTAPLPTEVRP